MNFYTDLILFDQRISASLVYWRRDFFDGFFLFITQFGHWPVIIILTVLAVGVFYLLKRRNLIGPLLLTVAGSGLCAVGLKSLVDRARPGPDIAVYVEKLSSFPSAHAALILALGGFLLYSLRWFKIGRTAKIGLSLLLLLLILLVGFSRVYLGVHFLSDVLAGYLIGFIWVLIGTARVKRRV